MSVQHHRHGKLSGLSTVVLGALAGVLIVVPAALAMVAQLAPQWLLALGLGPTDEIVSKASAVAAVHLLALLLSMRFASRTGWEAPLTRVAMQVLWIGVLLGAVFNVLVFGGVDRSEAYRLRIPTAPTLAQWAVDMPDPYPTAEVLLWFRQHAAGAVLSASEKDLLSAGLAIRRLQGISQLQVRIHDRDIAPTSAVNANRAWVRFVVDGAARPLWVDKAQAHVGARLCAVPGDEALLVISAADVPGCDAMRP